MLPLGNVGHGGRHNPVAPDVGRPDGDSVVVEGLAAQRREGRGQRTGTARGQRYVSQLHARGALRAQAEAGQLLGVGERKVSGALPMFCTVTACGPSVVSVVPAGVGEEKESVGGVARAIFIIVVLPLSAT